MPQIAGSPRHAALDAMLANWAAQPAAKLADVKFADDPAANQLVKENLTAFLIAASLDRGGNAFKIWDTPQKLLEKWGHLDTAKIQAMDLAVLAEDPILTQLSGQVSPRDRAKTIVSLATIIERDFGGNPEHLFHGDVDAVIHNLLQVHGIGPGIARTIAIQRLLYFDWQPSPGGRFLPKQDVHINRVLSRAGLLTAETDAQLREAVAGYDNRDVAIIDQEAWEIGVKFCHATKPSCGQCPITAVCPKALV